MVKSCCDSYHTQFSDFSAMLSYHEQVRKSSLWERTEVKKLQVAALDKTSPLYEDTDSFDPSVSRDAVEDTAENLKLAIKLRDKFFPLRDTAYKSLLDRAKIGGSALPKLSREKLADVINACLALHKDSALLLIRDEKVSAAHSGDSRITPCWRSTSCWTGSRARWMSVSRAISFLPGMWTTPSPAHPGRFPASGRNSLTPTSNCWLRRASRPWQPS